MSAEECARSRPVEAFEARDSIWSLIEGNTIDEGQSEIKKIIGSSLIEETVDLHQEVDTLLEIWRDFRDKTDNQNQVKSLLEPANVRKNLTEQIKLFVKLLQERAASGTRDFTRTLSPTQSEVVKSIVDPKGRRNSSSQRPQTAPSSSDGRQTPLRPSSCDRHSSCSSRLTDHFSIEHQARTTSEIERLADIIREELEEERIALRGDIEFLQLCLLDESSFRSSAESPSGELSLKELQDLGMKLEKELLVKEPTSLGKQKSEPLDKRKRTSPTPNPMPQSPARRVLPSPPSSAPSSKTRNNVIQRKQLTAKTMSFPIEESNKSDRNTQRLQLTSVEKRLDDRSSVIPGPTKRTSEKTTIVTTTVTAPCVTTGSNSRKLRQLVLDCRDDQS
eukprot:Seg3222.2 transcript_id=Seg3222.2/GoldUCD/mRNA.D3Y31 product="hypothetical protein" pseudo=true protein_id=Seg3222.2/GoldUCD/D3Y31